jgi:prepilin signal peptidase PulO-like enzyme (type II secretory pathway)
MEFIGALLLGWVSGMLVNYLADVLPYFRKLNNPTCLACGSPYRWQDYLLFKPCRNCARKRSPRTWVIQVLLTAASLWLFLRPPGRLGFAVGLFLLIYFALVAVIDFEFKAILFSTSIFGAVIGLMIGSSVHGLVTALVGGLVGIGIMFLFYQLGILFIKAMEKFRKTKIDEVALGLGDVYLMGGLGLMMGWPEVVGGILIAFILGGLISGGVILGSSLLKKYEPLRAIPYAPFLLLGAIIMIYIPAK